MSTRQRAAARGHPIAPGTAAYVARRVANPVRRGDGSRVAVRVLPRSHTVRNMVIVFGLPLLMMLSLCAGAWVLR